MIKYIEPTKEQIEYAKEKAKIEYGYRWEEDQQPGDYYDRFFGALGQIVICDILKKPRPEKTNCSDGFFDIEVITKKIDIKTRRINAKNDQYYWNSVPKKQINYKIDGYIFLIYGNNDGRIQVAGYTDKEEFLKKCTFHNPGERPNLKYPAYEIQDVNLKKLSTIAGKSRFWR